jgi:hypothetical protein
VERRGRQDLVEAVTVALNRGDDIVGTHTVDDGPLQPFFCPTSLRDPQRRRVVDLTARR